MLKWVRALWRRASEESLAVSQRGAAEIIREVRTAALQTEQDSTAAASGASMAVMNARMVAGMMGEMSSRMAEVNARMAESSQCVLTGVAEARNASTQVAVLTKAVAQIAATAGLISDIARITNLLSLNAAIEAARAGGAGAGFAVVADEVKELSRRTAQATEDIGEQLERIRQAHGAVRASVEVLDGGLTSIQTLIASVTGAVDEQGNSLAMVATCSKEAADSVEGFAATLDQIAGIARTTVQKCNDFEAVV
jgi:methyl-accepting chemotaxis protein